MESKPSSGGVLRRNRRLAPSSSSRYYPYATRGTFSRKEKMREEVIQLGVELSLCVVQSMFLLCDDVRTMLWFCFKCWRNQRGYPNPIFERLLRVMHFVYLRDIEPKKGVFKNHGNSAQWSLINNTWAEFHDGIIVMCRLVLALRRLDVTIDDRLLASAIVSYKQEVLESLKDKLRSAKDVSEANGFARETVESKIFDLWKSLFDKEAKEATETLQAIRNGVINDIFKPISRKPHHREIRALPPRSPYILGADHVKQHLKEDVVELGVELSLYVAESMFLLCDDTRSMLWFCYDLYRNATRNPDGPVVGKLVRVMHYVYSKHIKPNNGGRIYDKNDDNSSLMRTALKEDFAAGYRALDRLSSILSGEDSCTIGLMFTSRVEEALNKVDDKLTCVKHVSQGNGFAREAMESDIMDLWKSIFDKETEEALNVKMNMVGILIDLFNPLFEQRVKD